MAIITAREPGVCRRCKRDFPAGVKIEWAKGEPIYCTRSDCEDAAKAETADEPVGAAAGAGQAASYSFVRGEQSGVSHRGQHAHAGRATPAGTLPLLQPRAAAASEPAESPAAAVPLAAAFREQQLGELLPLLREVRDLLREALHACS